MGHGITELSDVAGIFLFAAGVQVQQGCLASLDLFVSLMVSPPPIQMAFFTQLSHQSFGPWNVGGTHVVPRSPASQPKFAFVIQGTKSVPSSRSSKPRALGI